MTKDGRFTEKGGGGGGEDWSTVGSMWWLWSSPTNKQTDWSLMTPTLMYSPLKSNYSSPFYSIIEGILLRHSRQYMYCIHNILGLYWIQNMYKFFVRYIYSTCNVQYDKKKSLSHMEWTIWNLDYRYLTSIFSNVEKGTNLVILYFSKKMNCYFIIPKSLSCVITQIKVPSLKL